jgi:hypothetical protein
MKNKGHGNVPPHTCDHLVAKRVRVFVPVLKLASSNFKIYCIYLFVRYLKDGLQVLILCFRAS